jgi:hypothetical protein
MKTTRLLRLYPRAWRDRYGEELLEVVGRDSVSLQQAVDIVSGAIDAWLSSEVHTATQVTTAGGGSMVRTMVCRKSETRYSKRDGAIGATVMIAATILFTLAGTVLSQSGWSELGEGIMNIGFLAAFTLSMPFWLTKGQPRRAQAALIGGTLTFLVLIAWLAAL